MGRAVLWLRRDLRLSDNPALVAAVRSAGRDGEVVPFFCVDRRLVEPAGAARLAFLAGCLDALDSATDGALVVRRGPPAVEVPALARQVGADRVFVAEDFGPYGAARDREVEAALADHDVELVRVGSPYAVPPGEVVSKSGDPYKVFTPFSRAWSAHGWPDPIPAPGRCRGRRTSTAKASPTRRRSTPGSTTACRGRRRCRRPGKAAGQARGPPLLRLPPGGLRRRPRPARPRRHVPPVALPEVGLPASPAAAGEAGAGAGPRGVPQRAVLARVLRRRAVAPSRHRAPGVRSGHAGDGDRRGRRHRRAVPGLVRGAHAPWFLQHLVDGDVASNQHGWQWDAGTGTDAAPYFRIFNPVRQGERYDPHGDYVRCRVPELRPVAGKSVHQPWKLAGGPPDGYPEPIVDHADERAEALRRYAEVKRGGRP